MRQRNDHRVIRRRSVCRRDPAQQFDQPLEGRAGCEAGFLPKVVQSTAMASLMKEDLDRWKEVVRTANLFAE